MYELLQGVCIWKKTLHGGHQPCRGRDILDGTEVGPLSMFELSSNVVVRLSLGLR